MSDKVKELLTRIEEKCKVMTPMVSTLVDAMTDFNKLDEDEELKNFTHEEKEELGNACQNSIIFQEAEEKFEQLRDLM